MYRGAAQRHTCGAILDTEGGEHLRKSHVDLEAVPLRVQLRVLHGGRELQQLNISIKANVITVVLSSREQLGNSHDLLTLRRRIDMDADLVT